MERWRWMPRDLGQHLRDAQHPGLHAARHASDGQQVWKTKRRGRQAGTMPTPLLTADDEVHHGQPDLERAALDHLQRIPAGAAGRTRRRCRAHRPQGRAEPGRHACASISRRASATRSAASASTSRTSSWSISTTRRTRTCSPMRSAPTATAACGSQNPLKYGEVLLS